MLLPWMATSMAGVLGLLIGSFLNVVVWRVPRGESVVPASHCPKCDAPIRAYQNVPVVSWLALRGRCASCRDPISARYPLVELSTGIAFALVAYWLTTEPLTASGLAWLLAIAAYLWFAAASVALTLIDIDHHRLPDAIVLPSLAVVSILLTAASLLQGDIGQLISTLGGGTAMFVVYFAIVLIYPAGMGLGDVKLAPLTGVMLGFVGWPAVAIGGFAAFLLGAAWGIALMMRRSATRKTPIPFGPFMLAGAWLGVAWGEPLWRGYLQLTGML